MTNTAIRTSVEEYFSFEWNLIHPDVQVQYENINFNPDDERSWVRLSIQPVAINKIGINDCKEAIGLVGIQVYTSLKKGMQENDILVDDVIEIFNKADLLEARFQDVVINSLGEVNDRHNATNIFVDYLT